MSDPYTPSLQHPVPARKSKVINDTNSHSGNWSLIQVQEDTILTSITAPLKENAAGLVGPTLPAGYQINGPVNQIQLASGSVEAHENY
jgi:hypothetical protein